MICNDCAFCYNEEQRCHLNRHIYLGVNPPECSAFRTKDYLKTHKRPIIDIMNELAPKLDVVIIDNHVECLNYAKQLRNIQGILLITNNEEHLKLSDNKTKVIYYVSSEKPGMDDINQVIYENISAMCGTHLAVLDNVPKNNIYEYIHQQEIIQCKKNRLYLFADNESFIISTQVLRLTKQHVYGLLREITKNYGKYTDYHINS